MTIDTWLMNASVKSQWIAFFTLWLFWLTYAVFDTFLFHPDIDYAVIHPVVQEGGQPIQPRHETYLERTLHWHIIRHHRTMKLLRDYTLALLCALTLNSFGRGGTVSAEVLAWIYVGFAITHAVCYHAGITHRVVTGSVTLVQGVLLLAIISISYAVGWATA